MEKIDVTGRLLEFSYSRLTDKEAIFGIVEMSGLRIIGSFDDAKLKEGMTVKMTECGIKQDGSIFYRFSQA